MNLTPAQIEYLNTFSTDDASRDALAEVFRELNTLMEAQAHCLIAGEIAKLSLSPGDKILVSMHGKSRPEDREYIRNIVQQWAGRHDVLVVPVGLQISVASQASI